MPEPPPSRPSSPVTSSSTNMITLSAMSTLVAERPAGAADARRALQPERICPRVTTLAREPRAFCSLTHSGQRNPTGAGIMHSWQIGPAAVGARDAGLAVGVPVAVLDLDVVRHLRLEVGRHVAAREAVHVAHGQVSYRQRQRGKQVAQPLGHGAGARGLALAHGQPGPAGHQQQAVLARDLVVEGERRRPDRGERGADREQVVDARRTQVPEARLDDRQDDARARGSS